MKLPFLSKKISKSSTFVALDVGTVFVKALIYSIEDERIVVKGYGKIRQQEDVMRSGMIINLERVISNCDLAIGKAVENLRDEALPKEMSVGIAGELVQGITIMANYERENPKDKIDKDEIKEVIERVRSNAFNDAKKEIAEHTGLIDEQIEEIDSVVNDTFIDGFRVANPIGFQGKEVSFRVFSTFAPSLHINSLKTISESLDLKLNSIVVEPYAVTRSFKGSKKDEFSAIFIDVGGGTSDVALVHEGGIIGTKMIAFGGNLFSKRLEKEFNIPFKKAEELKIQYSEGQLNDEKSRKIKEILKQDAQVWADGIQLALEEFDDVKNYPTQILLCGGGSLLPEIKEALLDHPWLQVLRFSKFPDIQHITPDKIASLVDNNKLLKGTMDIAPAALAYMSLEKN